MTFDWNDYPNATVAVRINLGMTPLHVLHDYIMDTATGWRDHEWCHFETHEEAEAFVVAFPAWVLELDETPVRREPRRTVQKPLSMQSLTAIIRDSQRRQFLKPKKRARA